MDIINNALEYYDKCKIKYDKILSKIKYYKYISKNSDIEKSEIIFYDKNKEVIFKSPYEVVGNYYANESIWIWAWGILTYSKNRIYQSKKILLYGLDIDCNTENNGQSENDYQNLFLKFELTTPRFKINNYIQLDIHIAICAYITKNPIIIPQLYYQDTNGTPSNDIHKFKNINIYNIDNNNAKYYNLVFLFILDYEQVDELLKNIK
jgi:hypothetical protein